MYVTCMELDIGKELDTSTSFSQDEKEFERKDNALDIDAILAEALLKTGLKPQFKNCVRVDIWQATETRIKADALITKMKCRGFLASKKRLTPGSNPTNSYLGLRLVM